MQPLTAQFKTYLAGPINLNSQTGAHLAKPKLAPASLKNYVSDVDQFLAWLAHELQEPVIQPANLSPAVFQNYGRYLNAAENGINPATATRAISGLRRFSDWLVTTKRTEINPAAQLTAANIDPTINQVLREFKNELTRQNLSASTIKNYVSDVNHYLLWAKEHLRITDGNIL